MAWQAFTDPAERGHLIADVPALFLIAIVLAVLMQMGSSERATTAASTALPPRARIIAPACDASGLSVATIPPRDTTMERPCVRF